MPFFQSKTDRIFEDTLRESAARASRLLTSPSLEIAHLLLGTANGSAQATAKTIMSKRRLRTTLDKQKVRQLCRLFTLDALSRYLASLDNQQLAPPSEDERKNARESWAGVINNVFLGGGEESIRAYVSLDRQYRYDYYDRQRKIEEQGGFVIYSLYDIILIGAVMEVLGNASLVEIPSELPVQYDDTLATFARGVKDGSSTRTENASPRMGPCCRRELGFLRQWTCSGGGNG